MLRIDSTPFLFRNSTPKYLPESYEIHHHYGIAILNVKDHENVIISEINEDFLLLSGWEEDNLIGINLHENPIWNDDGQLWNAICKCLAEQKTQVLNWNITNGNTSRSIGCSIVPTTCGNDDRPETLSLILSNNSAELAFIDQMQKFNYYDRLTGLPNQNFLNEKIEKEFSDNFPNGEIAILLLNIIKFQRINESFGYELGDEIIQKISYRLEAILPANATLVRFDGDKYAILISDNDAGSIKKESEALASLLHYEMNKPVPVDGQEIHLSLTIGIAVATTALKDGNKLIQQAHIALQRLNSASRTKTLLYQPELQTRANSRLKLENELREMLKNRKLSLNYQPIISLHNGQLIGFEALCRWNHPTRGMISPVEFIPLSEETGLIIPLGNWALREACNSLKIWVDKFPNLSNLTMNVNVSGLQLLQESFVSTTQETLLNSGLAGHQLKLEITESTLIENAEVARDILLDLKALDISLAIDDFGTGYSSLSYLNQFPIDTLKIDKSFINRMNATKDSYKIIHIISTLAQTLGMNLVAEGIEHKDQLLALKKLGYNMGQGFLFSRPLSFDDAEQYIRKELTSLV
ncbi:diguanylate cyclase/phosphodiesterase (GGDEF & EAL domains) with PAS/PAC sensor(s) [hydrothermal vent metagenome]|uniref:Diguanylate cyclase/phosphodiesterase (GGDEF & EAL domains) with PAS/PAC sensor(S) n=1 Tax=hydrothermal vent metagenome TaxID=652676 RepID=A0A3B0S349_9ZZZZ